MGDARPWLMARWKTHGRLSIRVNWTFFAVYNGCGVMRRNVYTEQLGCFHCFHRVDLFAFKFYLDRVVRHQPLLAPEN